MPSAFSYLQHSNITFPDVSGEVVNAGDAHVVTLLDETYPSGVELGKPFFTNYEGQVLFDTSRASPYNFELTVTHFLSDGTEIQVPMRRQSSRVGGNEEYSLPLNGYSSYSVIPDDGTYTPEHLKDPVRLVIELAIMLDGTNSFTIEKLTALNAAVTFYQFADYPESGSPPPVVPDLLPADTLKERIDKVLVANGYDVRQWDNRGKGTIESKFTGMVVFNNRLVPRVEVTMYTIGIDGENETRRLSDMLKKVPDCFPAVDNINVTHIDRTNQNTNRRYSVIRIICRGA